ncbi:MAG: YkvA family protein [Methanospirillum sp.]
MGLIKTVRRLTTLNSRLRRFRGSLEMLLIGVRDPRVPIAAKAVMIATLAYVASPIDLIPDFIPFVGHLDDMILIPIGVMLAVSMLPPGLRNEYDAVRRGVPVSA